jgi:hypothetical protein
MKRIFDVAFFALCVCGLLWSVWTIGYYYGAMHVCEMAVKAGHATKTEFSGATRYSFKAMRE